MHTNTAQYLSAAILSLLLSLGLQAQPAQEPAANPNGRLSALLSCYDVHFYELEVKIDPDLQRIGGSNVIHFTATDKLQQLQFHLHKDLNIARIEYKGGKLPFDRREDEVLVRFPETIARGSRDQFKVVYGGTPPAGSESAGAGGFEWYQAETGKHIFGVSAQGAGSRSWWPLKDHLSDKADSMDISLIVPEQLMAIGNGKLVQQERLPGNFIRYQWETRSAVGNQRPACYAGTYTLVQDVYKDISGAYRHLNYYVLPEREHRSAHHFKQVKEILRFLEARLGAYPFWKDGFKLIETPLGGTDHTGAFAYGGDFANNEYGFDPKLFHMLAQEWFGNSLTAADPAERWIQEAFASYLAAMYVEYVRDYDAAVAYLSQTRKDIRSETAIPGAMDEHFRGNDQDVYLKGSWMLHSLRNAVDDDALWYDSLGKLAIQYRNRPVSTPELIAFFNEQFGKDYSWLFEHYLRQKELPVFAYRILKSGNRFEMEYRWQGVEADFRLPVYVFIMGIRIRLQPGLQWQSLSERNVTPRHFQIDANAGLFEVVESR